MDSKPIANKRAGSSPASGISNVVSNITWSTGTSTYSSTVTIYPLISRETYARRRKLPFKECSGCGTIDIHDHDDYLCWYCRDKTPDLRFVESTNGTVSLNQVVGTIL